MFYWKTSYFVVEIPQFHPYLFMLTPLLNIIYFPRRKSIQFSPIEVVNFSLIIEVRLAETWKWTLSTLEQFEQWTQRIYNLSEWGNKSPESVCNTLSWLRSTFICIANGLVLFEFDPAVCEKLACRHWPLRRVLRMHDSICTCTRLNQAKFKNNHTTRLWQDESNAHTSTRYQPAYWTVDTFIGQMKSACD